VRPPPLASINGWSILSSWSFCYCCCSWDPPTKFQNQGKRKERQNKSKINPWGWFLLDFVLNGEICFLQFFWFLPFPPISKDAPKLCRLLQAFRSFVSTENEQETLLREREREKNPKTFTIVKPQLLLEGPTHTHTVVGKRMDFMPLLWVFLFTHMSNLVDGRVSCKSLMG